MNPVFHELTLNSQKKFNEVRRKVQFFSTFAGGVVEALRELGYRLSNFEKEFSFSSLRQPQGVGAHSTSFTEAAGGNNMELYFEQQDSDQCKVLIVPFRTDLPYLSKAGYTAQLGLELSRYTSDPDLLRAALDMNTKRQWGSFLGGQFGGKRLPKLYLDSPPHIRQPGSMTFELRGARLVVAMNILTNLDKYRLKDYDLDIEKIKSDFEAYFYGLEKFLGLLQKNLDSGEIAPQNSSPPEEQAPAEEPETAGTMKQTVHLGNLAQQAAEAMEQRDPNSQTQRLDQLPPPPEES